MSFQRYLREQLEKEDGQSRAQRTERAVELRNTFHSIPSLISSPNSGLVFDEIHSTYMAGAHAACVLLCDSYAEKTLGLWVFTLTQTRPPKGHAKLRQAALDLGLINPSLSEALHVLRKHKTFYELPYFYMEEGTGTSTRLKEGQSIEGLAREDAMYAIRIVADLMRCLLAFKERLLPKNSRHPEPKASVEIAQNEAPQTAVSALRAPAETQEQVDIGRDLPEARVL